MAKSVTEALKIATTLSGGHELVNPYSEFIKNEITLIKSSNLSDKDELHRLNIKLRTYLDDVKKLETLNLFLIDQVNKARELAIPRPMDKTSLDRQIEEIRLRLEDVSNGVVRAQVNIEESESLKRNWADRTRFWQDGAETERKKIQQLLLLLDEIKNQRDFLVRSATMAQDEIAREREKMDKANLDLEKLLKSLKESRKANKSIEFQIETLMDQLAFTKAIFAEEIAEMSKRPQALSATDLTSFYKSELLTAIKQIRQDFQKLNDDQLREYRERKEREYSMVVKQAEEDRMHMEMVQVKLLQGQDVEKQTSGQLRSGMKANETEIEQLKAQNAHMIHRLGELEGRYQDLKLKNRDKLDRLLSEIALLKDQNESYVNDSDYIASRMKVRGLRDEIEIYRSILNYQSKILQNVPLTYAGSTIVTTTTTTSSSSAESEAITILRQVFNYFDSDRSGTINSRELDGILSRLNVKLTGDAYNQLMREFDRDGNRSIDFSEFCKIMLPVYTGKFDDEELWYAFKRFDPGNTGYITVAQLQNILSKIGQNYTASQIEAMVRTVDADFDGRLNFREFSRLMKSKLM